MGIGITVVGINNSGVQNTAHKEKSITENDEEKDDYASEGSDKGIPEGDVNQPQITSKTELHIFNLSSRKLRNYSKKLRVDAYNNPQIVHYAMAKYSLRKGLKKFKKVG